MAILEKNTNPPNTGLYDHIVEIMGWQGALPSNIAHTMNKTGFSKKVRGIIYTLPNKNNKSMHNSVVRQFKAHLTANGYRYVNKPI